MEACIYALVDPRFDAVCYIGKTLNHRGCRSERLGTHFRVAEFDPAAPVSRWIRELQAVGLRPEMRVIHCCSDKIVQAVEVQYIAEAYRKNPDLLNRHFTPGVWLRGITEDQMTDLILKKYLHCLSSRHGRPSW